MGEMEETWGEPSDALSLADLRDVARLRKDVTRLEDENRFMREQLGQAVAGWRDEQRRTKEIEQSLKSLPAPDEVDGPEPPARPAAVPAPAPRQDAAPEEEGKRPPGLWASLWGWLAD